MNTVTAILFKTAAAPQKQGCLCNDTYVRIDQESYNDIIDKLSAVLELFSPQSEPWRNLFEIERLLNNIDPKTGSRLTGTRRVELPSWLEHELGLDLPD